MSKCEQCIVRQFNSLKALTKDELMRISACKTSKVFKRGETIFKEGESLNGVFCVRDGVCKAAKLSENGNDQIIKLVSKGDLIGQRSLISNETANLSATAISDVELCFIPKDEILNDLKKNSNFTFDLLQNMASELKDADNAIVNLAQNSVKKRLADTLIYVQDRFGCDEEGFLNLILSREDYANIVGTAIESAIRVLSHFKKEKLVDTSGKRIKILDIKGLNRVA